MATLVERPRDLRCKVEADNRARSWTVMLRPFRSDQYAWLLLFVMVCILTLWFAKEVWSWRKDFGDWFVITFVALSAVSLSWCCLIRLTVRGFRVRRGELFVTKAILGVRRHFRIESGGFELQRFHACEDMKDEPYGFQLEVIEPTGKRVTLVHVYWWDRDFVHDLMSFLCEETGWICAEKEIYSPPSRGGESGP